MLTTFEQVREWITDNGFKRWVLYKDYSKTEKIIDSAAFAVSDMPDKLAMTEKYLRLAGGHAYAAGAPTNAVNDLTTTAEIRLAEETAPAAGVGYTAAPVNEAQLRETIRKEMQAEWDKREYEQKRKQLDEERKEFEADKQSAIGLITGYLAPVAKAMMQRHVAGVPQDAEEPVNADPIQPIVAERPQMPQEPEHEPEEQEEQSPFTDEEADELFDLMARFKKVEPQYLELIKAVVAMAESGDSTYTMAKGFLIK